MAKATKQKVEKKSEAATMTLPELRLELQKVILQVKSGEEKNTTKIKSIKKQIARELTKANSK